MLRFQPSELTLTSADIDETRRRLADRQVAESTPLTSRRIPKPRPGQPRIRRGPKQFRDTAITRLGVIPVLRPHSAVHSSADSDYDDGLPGKPTFTDASDSTIIGNVANASSPEEQQLPAVNSPNVYGVLASPNARRPITHHHVPREILEDEVQSSPLRYSFGFSGFGRARTNTSEDTNEGPSQRTAQIANDEAVESTQLSSNNDQGEPHVARVQSVRQLSSYASSPLHQSQPVSAPPTSWTDQQNQLQLEEEHPSLFLQGYFATPDQYTFRECFVPPGNTRSRGHTSPVRTASPHGAPSPQDWSAASIRQHRRNAGTRGSTTEDSFSTSEAFNLGVTEGEATSRSLMGTTQTAEQLHHNAPGDPPSGIRQYQRSSQRSSSSSQPYSYYELPPTRYSSSNFSHNGDHLPQAQYDGSITSRQANRGIYYSIRPSEAQPTCISNIRPLPIRISSYSSPNLTTGLGNHGLSPRPASPYGRTHSTHNSPRPSAGLISSNDFVLSAADAARRDLPSPLDLIQHRAASQMSRLASGTSFHTASSQPRGSRGSSAFQYQVPNLGRRDSLVRKESIGSDANGFRYISSSRYPSLATDGDRYPGFSIRLPQSYNITPPPRDHTSPLQRGDALDVRQVDGTDISILPLSWPAPLDRRLSPPIALLSTPQSRRNPAEGRPGQRSSNENDPVGASATSHSSPAPLAQRERDGDLLSSSRAAQRVQALPAPLIQPRTLPAVPRVDTSVANSSPVDRSNRPRLSSPRQVESILRAPPVRRPRTHDTRQIPTRPIASVPSQSREHVSGQNSHSAVTPHQRRRGQDHSDYSSRSGAAANVSSPSARLEAQTNRLHRLGELIQAQGNQTRAHTQQEGTTSPRRPNPGRRGAIASVQPPRRRTIPASQQNQENSGEAEEEMMREEMRRRERSRGMRGGANQEGLTNANADLEIMDETPPRLGRFERMMGL